MSTQHLSNANKYCEDSILHPDIASGSSALNKIFKAGKEGFPNGISAQKYSALAKCAKATATRDLGDLVSKGCLRVEGEGRGVRYFINRV